MPIKYKQTPKQKETTQIIRQDKLAPDIYSLWLATKTVAGAAAPGQFISIYSKDGSRLLPRPISICEIDHANDAIRIVYRTAGPGTQEFSKLTSGDTLELLGPLGNGFPLGRLTPDKKALLIAGGIGIPPMVELAKSIPGHATIVSGYRDELFLQTELSSHGTLYIATEDGSTGTKGNVIDAIKANNLTADIIYACGPTPMLRALKSYAAEQGIECWISMEERIACGIGACLACVCQSTQVDSHSNVHNKRICKDGPVFLSTEVEL